MLNKHTFLVVSICLDIQFPASKISNRSGRSSTQISDRRLSESFSWR
jgi:hypothetical protein